MPKVPKVPKVQEDFEERPLPSLNPLIREGLKKSEYKTLDLFFRYCKGHPVLPCAELTRRYSSAGRALHSLAETGLVSLEKQRVYRNPFGKVPPFFPQPEFLTP
ncbi:MAG: hypothetical protein D3909_08205, partial [Candidatus Electrothrix sp. ATG1]|nr:hypothetical protein [Candidatus Electrothrix sp. ATG1]